LATTPFLARVTGRAAVLRSVEDAASAYSAIHRAIGSAGATVSAARSIPSSAAAAPSSRTDIHRGVPTAVAVAPSRLFAPSVGGRRIHGAASSQCVGTIGAAGSRAGFFRLQVSWFETEDVSARHQGERGKSKNIWRAKLFLALLHADPQAWGGPPLEKWKRGLRWSRYCETSAFVSTVALKTTDKFSAP
jgi:hypothetical protein